MAAIKLFMQTLLVLAVVFAIFAIAGLGVEIVMLLNSDASKALLRNNP